MDVAWSDLQLFLAAWEAGTLTGAAKATGLGQATLSRRMAALEEQLGLTLFDRSRGGLRPTDAARALHPHVEAMARAARQAGAALQDLEARPAGRVRIACPPGVAVDLLPPLLPILARRHPLIEVELLADNLMADLARHEVDVALRSEAPTSGDLVFRRLGAVRVGVFASPAYVAALPPDATLRALAWITWSDDMAHIPAARWVALHLEGRPAALRSNSFLAMRAAAQAGVGCVLIPEVQARVGGLVRVPVPTPDLGEVPWFLVTPRALRRVPRVAAVVDFLTEALAGADMLEAWPPADLG